MPDSSADPRARAAQPPPIPRGDAPPRLGAPLIGRDAELAELDAVYARAVDYHAPQLVTVIGTQGTGKSRLVSEWLARLLARRPAGTDGRPRVYRGRASAGAGSYALVNRLLRDRFALADSDDEAQKLEKVRTQLTGVFADRRMAEVIHFLGRYLDLRVSDNAFLRAISLSEDPRQEERIARTVLRRFLELDAERTPIVLAFDDLHLGDDDSLTLLGELAEGLGGSPVLLLAAARPELFVRRPAWGAGGVDHTRLELPPLARADAERLLRSLLARAEPLPADLVDDACELTRGNPFFMEELVRVFHANGTVSVQGERWRIDPVRAAQATLPMSVEEAIQARIAALSPLERDLLEKAAVLGSVFWMGALVVLSRLERAEARDHNHDHQEGSRDFAPAERARIEAALAELVERDYLLKMPDSTVTGEVEYIFKHNLEHDLVLRLVPPVRARRYYRAAAEWLELRLPADRQEQSGEQLEYLAALYHEGGASGRAAGCYLAAADKARQRFANEAAAELYARGLGLLDADELLARIDPLHDYGDVLARMGRAGEALAVFEQMRDAAWRLDHAAKAGAAESRIARACRTLGDYERAEQHLGRALGLFQAALDLRGLAGVEDDLGRLAFLRGAYASAREHHGRALGLRSDLGDERSLALSLFNLGLVHQAEGAHEAALGRFGEALDLGRRLGDRAGMVQALEALAALWRDRAQLERALELLGEALALAQEIGDRMEHTAILTRMGEALAHLGRGDEASHHLAQASELAQSFGDKLLCSEAARQLAEVYLQLDDVGRARHEAERALDLANKVGSRPAAGMAHRVLGAVLGRAAASDGERAEAERHLVRSIEVLNELGHELELGRSCQGYAELLSRRGDSDGAATWRARASEIAARLAPRADGATLRST